MKALLTCDDVFDILTREPFPSGGSDDEVVESHLAVCHECRQLAEAFRPAVGLFHESLSASCDDELPMYRGRLKPMIDALPDRSSRASREDDGAQRQRRHAWMSCWLAVAASLFLVGSVAVAMLAARQSDSGSVPVASTVRATQDRDYTLLAALEIPSSCRSLLEDSDHSFAMGAEFVCCTKCHHSTSRVASTSLAITKTSAACAACHDRMRGDTVSLVAPRTPWCKSLLACAAVHRL